MHLRTELTPPLEGHPLHPQMEGASKDPKGTGIPLGGRQGEQWGAGAVPGGRVVAQTVAAWEGLGGRRSGIWSWATGGLSAESLISVAGALGWSWAWAGSEPGWSWAGAGPGLGRSRAWAGCSPTAHQLCSFA